jgi:uncharacterized membrane protein YbhN (UPF0104 family)
VRTRAVKWMFPVLFSAAGTVAVLRSLGSFGALSSVHVHWLDLAALSAVYLLFMAGRGVRFRVLIRSQEPWLCTAEVGWVYTAACNVFPGGMGEFCLPAIYRRLPQGTARATAALTLARLLDLLSWLPFLALGFFLSGVPRGAFALLPVSLAGIALIAAFVFVRPFRTRLLALLARWPSPAVGRFLTQFEQHLEEMAKDTGATLITIALRLLSVASYYFALHAVGVDVSWAAAAVGGALVALLLALPVQGVAGIGTVELWWISVLHLYGVPLPAAAVGAIGLHLSTLILSLAVGALALVGSRSLTLEGLVSP